jgi:hypothetical protein
MARSRSRLLHERCISAPRRGKLRIEPRDRYALLLRCIALVSCRRSCGPDQRCAIAARLRATATRAAVSVAARRLASRHQPQAEPAGTEDQRARAGLGAAATCWSGDPARVSNSLWAHRVIRVHMHTCTHQQTRTKPQASDICSHIHRHPQVRSKSLRSMRLSNASTGSSSTCKQT